MLFSVAKLPVIRRKLRRRLRRRRLIHPARNDDIIEMNKDENGLIQKEDNSGSNAKNDNGAAMLNCNGFILEVNPHSYMKLNNLENSALHSEVQSIEKHYHQLYEELDGNGIPDEKLQHLSVIDQIV